jgi:translation initiation factor IF-3
MAIKALHIEAFMSKVQRAKVMLMFWGRRKLIRSPEGIERRWRPRSWFKYIEMG